MQLRRSNKLSWLVEFFQRRDHMTVGLHVTVALWGRTGYAAERLSTSTHLYAPLYVTSLLDLDLPQQCDHG